MLDQPANHLDPRARTVWRLGGFLGLLVLSVALVPLAVVLLWNDLVEWWWVALVAVVILGLGVAAAYWIPGLIWNRWRYAVGEEEVDLQSGVVVVTRALIPMARIQHVDTRNGPLQRRFGLASVVLYTAAGSNEIPALDAETAARVRDRIARLANVRDDL